MEVSREIIEKACEGHHEGFRWLNQARLEFPRIYCGFNVTPGAITIQEDYIGCPEMDICLAQVCNSLP